MNFLSNAKLGIRLGNWLTAGQAHTVWQAPNRERMKGKRDRALLALLMACDSVVMSWERLVTFEPFPSQIGSAACSTNGLMSQMQRAMRSFKISMRQERSPCRQRRLSDQ